ncbi:hypothetical protein PBI_LAMBO_82 [Gordonia phage Lambo]|uniref:Uncharacterized protein n=2 Tax=Lambovirus TaxID=2843412 RepID=A0A5J6TT66_9CAUD|nr:hypothetical protein HWC70_gp82 [Gordonia phage Lambo]QFG13588.1 hypothetical protein PBI_LAMBO_82 [Gordonia phage Lambo]UJQ86150.1 hypothetical protein ZANY_81 [Gordonia phage Zany]
MIKSVIISSRPTLDYSTSGQVAELKASQLSFEDLDRWMFWESDNGIQSLRIKSITHGKAPMEYGPDKKVIIVSGQNINASVTLDPHNDVYVCETKPKVTIFGVEVPKK